MNFEIASTGFSFSAFLRFAQLAKQADIIHYHFPWPFMDLVHFATRIKKPSIVTYHSDIIRQEKLLKLYRPLKNRFLASVDKIVATSPNYFESSAVLAQYRHKTEVIPIGLDKSTFTVPSFQLIEHWRKQIGDRFFLFVGVLRYYKGLHILLDALREVDYPVVIVGAGLMELELKEHARQLGLKNIHFLGALPEEDKIALFKLCYAVVFPSHLRSEAFGVSLLEGAMYGKPLISSEIGTGTSYININQQTGLVIPPGDAKLLEQAMRFLWNNPIIAEKLGEQAEKRYFEFFTAKLMASRYVDSYRLLLNEAQKRSRLFARQDKLD
jgi:rhamnosyl/mannosyltransferase